ncbi:techylectin-like protein isoform X2 [Parasteatoda tepidariorum]|uniref:techylectin-like protein isoform X2 n=1 Tax=Parasteatoda tepidariorum TaxID=114398 RepID=UPI001C71A780|nr:techylectin-5A isoform X2 [Parasteatoda tepidariorum]
MATGLLWGSALTLLCTAMLVDGRVKGGAAGRRKYPRSPIPLLKKELNDTHPDFSYNGILDAAMVLIRAAKRMGPSLNGELSTLERMDGDADVVEDGGRCPPRPIDCEELLQECEVVVSGVYRVYPRSRVETWGDGGFEVYCDMETDGGGWTLIQKRDDYGAKPDFFYKDWASYKAGFGEMEYDYWLGNDKIFALSNQRPSTLRFDLFDFEGGRGFATYDNFYIEDESQAYRLHIGDYRGDVGDSFSAHNNCKFTTKDRHNDNNYFENCAQRYFGGWWYNSCHTVNILGLYLKGSHLSYADGVNWYLYKGFHYSLKRTEMKTRSVGFARLINMDVARQDTFDEVFRIAA